MTDCPTWYYCTGCRMEVHRRELEHDVQPPYSPWHRKCGAFVEVRKS